MIVNRLWQHHFGQGIVGTPNDFGAQGERPTHPELLDCLAGELIRGGWKLKPIHKLIMISAVYLQAGDVEPGEPEGRPGRTACWWRCRRGGWKPRRSATPCWPSAARSTRRCTAPARSTQHAAAQRLPTVKRSQLIRCMQMFDAPEPIQSIGERSATTVPTQALAMMNSPFVRQQAEKLAAAHPPAKDAAARSGRSTRPTCIALGRRPTDAERERMLAFIEQQAASYGQRAAGRRSRRWPTSARCCCASMSSCTSID